MSDISLHDHEWRLEVTKQLATLVQQTKDLVEQVKRQNGNVARLWTERDELSRRITSTEAKIGAHVATTKAAEKATVPWKRWAERLVFAAIGILFILVLSNASSILKAFKVGL